MERYITLNCPLIKQTQMTTLIHKFSTSMLHRRSITHITPPSSPPPPPSSPTQYGSFTGFAFDIDIFKSEAKRFETFKNWPVNYIDKCTLAATGMFYTGIADKVRCYFCDVELEHWRKGDHPVQEHIIYSNECPLMKRRLTNNIPKDPAILERILPPLYGSDSINGKTHIDICYGSYPEGTISSSCTEQQLMDKISYPEYASEESRLYSFADWPYTYHTQPEKLAEAGLFYTGIEDRVNCFACGGGLKDWSLDDDPWLEHATKLDGKCCFLLSVKGQKFLDFARGDFNVTTKTVSQPERDDSAVSSNGNITFVSDQACKICYESQYNTAFLPCGHVVSCNNCAKLLSECPMCRCEIEKTINVYF